VYCLGEANESIDQAFKSRFTPLAKETGAQGAERIYHEWDAALGAKHLSTLPWRYTLPIVFGIAARPAPVGGGTRHSRGTGKAAGIRAHRL